MFGSDILRNNMNEMYKTDSIQPRPVVDASKSEDKKIQELEQKIKELSLKITNLETSLSRINRAVRRQGTDISNVAGSINRNRY